MSKYYIPAGKHKYNVEIDDDLMTGETYPIKEVIKTYFSGKWIADKKAWQVNLQDVSRWMGMKIHPASQQTSQAPVVKRHPVNGLCPRCGTYCYGDCTAN